MKCTEPASGKVAYTDGACGAAAGQQLMEKPSPGQLAEQEAQVQRARAEFLRGEALSARARPSEAPLWPTANAGALAAGGDACGQARHVLDVVRNDRYVTPQQSAERVAAAERRQDEACAGPPHRVVVRYLRGVPRVPFVAVPRVVEPRAAMPRAGGVRHIR